MPDRTYIILDATIALITTMTTIMTAVLAQIVPHGEELQNLLVPLVGAMISSGGMVLLYPEREARKVIIGISAFSLFFGCALPQVIPLVFEGTSKFFEHPVIQLLAGAIAALLVFVLIKPIVLNLVRRSNRLANSLLDAAENRIPGKFNQDTKN